MRAFVERAWAGLLVVAGLFVAEAAAPCGAGAESESEVEGRNKAAVLARFDAWRAGTGSPFELLADNVSWTIVGHSLASKTYVGRDVLIREVIAPFNARMREGLKPTIRKLYADGDAVIIYFDARGVARDGKPYANTYAWFFELHEGKVTKATAFYDSVVFNDLWQRVSPAAVK